MKPGFTEGSPRLLLLAAALLAAGGVLLNSLVQAQTTFNPNDAKTSYGVQAAFMGVVKEASRSTVRIWVQGDDGQQRAAALGTIISEDGYILTKGSEVVGLPRVMVKLANTELRDAKIIGWSQTYDLALLKINAKGLKPVVFADTRPPVVPPAPGPGAGIGVGGFGGGFGGGGFGGRGRTPRGPVQVTLPTMTDSPAPPEGAIAVTVGEWVATVNAGATAGADLPPLYVGVISVGRRKIAPDAPGILGVMMDETTPNKVGEVVPHSGAENAGMKVGDVIVSVDGSDIRTVDDLHRIMRSHSIGDAVSVDVMRGTQRLNLRIVIGTDPDDADPEVEALSGQVSKRATNFPAVFQHDTLLDPAECGGPLVDLDGHVLGINIARAGRTEAYAIPADLIVADIAVLKSGELAPPAFVPKSSKPAGK